MHIPSFVYRDHQMQPVQNAVQQWQDQYGNHREENKPRVHHISPDKPGAARTGLARIRETWARIREACETLATQPEPGEQRQGFGVPGCKSFSVGN